VAIKQAGRDHGVDILVNARVDVFRGQPEQSAVLLAEAIRRARLYVEAGADSVYPITLDRQPLIQQFVSGAPATVNILLRGTLTVPPCPPLASGASASAACCSAAPTRSQELRQRPCAPARRPRTKPGVATHSRAEESTWAWVVLMMRTSV